MTGRAAGRVNHNKLRRPGTMPCCALRNTALSLHRAARRGALAAPSRCCTGIVRHACCLRRPHRSFHRAQRRVLVSGHAIPEACIGYLQHARHAAGRYKYIRRGELRWAQDATDGTTTREWLSVLAIAAHCRWLGPTGARRSAGRLRYRRTPAASAGALEEIVVTAQKALRRLIDVPMSVTAITGDSLQQSGAVTTETTPHGPGVGTRRRLLDKSSFAAWRTP